MSFVLSSRLSCSQVFSLFLSICLHFDILFDFLSSDAHVVQLNTRVTSHLQEIIDYFPCPQRRTSTRLIIGNELSIPPPFDVATCKIKRLDQ